MHLKFETRKILFNAIVPLQCGSEHATAFFVGEDTLLTVRHAVIDHLYNKETPVFIDMGESILCEVEELGGHNDVVILKCTKHIPHETLQLLAAEFNEDLELKVIGYPSELGNNKDLISLSIRNRQQVHRLEYDIVVIREDTLALYSYKGFSGSPVINEFGSVIGIMTRSVSQTLGYISIRQLTSPWLDKKNIPYKQDHFSEDTSTYGRRTSQNQIYKAIKLAGNRYNPKLHQDISDFSVKLYNFINKDGFENVKKQCEKYRQWFLSSKRTFRDEVQKILKQNEAYKKEFPSLREKDDELWAFFELSENSEESSERDFYIENLPNYQKFSETINDYYKKVIIVRGNAGCGKTHFLCHEAQKLCKQINVYLLFGSQFTASEEIIPQICKLLNFDKTDLNLLDDKMKQNDSIALLIIDALNEGAEDSYWKKQLPVLYDTINNCNNIKLILSVRSQSDDYLYSTFAKNKNVEDMTIDGFSDVEKATNDYFKEYRIENPENKTIMQRYKSDFKNPLFLKIFCQAAKSYGINNVIDSPRSNLYVYYILEKNADICRKVDEDEYRYITIKFLMDLANYSLNYRHCLPVPREKARIYADRICRNRTWSNNLLNVCLKENVLLPIINNNYNCVQFEYEQLGDFLKVATIKNSKRNEQSIRSFLLDENKKHSSRYLEHFIIALLSEWDFSDALLLDNTFTNTFKKELFESIKLQNINRERIAKWSLENRIYEPYSILDLIDSLSVDNIRVFNSAMLAMTMYERDMKWSVYIGDLYKEYYEDDFRQRIGFQIHSEDDAYIKCILFLWMCTSPHPQVRHIILRRIVSIMKKFGNTGFVSLLIEDLHTCNDPYVLHILYAAVYGYSLISRDKNAISEIAKKIKQSHYSDRAQAPLDIIVRHWTLSLLAFSRELGNEDLLSQVQPPYESMNPNGLIIDEWDDITENYFGTSYPSQLLYESINGFEDFNRYIIGTNSRNTSNIYINEKEGQTSFVLLDDILLMINNLIKHEYNWTDEIGVLFKDSYSSNRFKNKTERIGKKYQWLALYKVEALLSDHCKMTDGYKDRYNSNIYDDLPSIPFPWYSDVIPYIDPTMTDEDKCGMEPQEDGSLNIGEKMSDDDWMDRKFPLPLPVFIITNKQGIQWLVLKSHQSCDQVITKLNRELFLFVDSIFIKEEDIHAFNSWAKDKNFHGGWMPESHGAYEFLWNEYTWSDRYKRTKCYEYEKRPHGCPCDIIISNKGQLQENYDGLRNADNFLSTAYAPNEGLMNKLDLYTAERGVVRKKKTDEVVSMNFCKKGFNGIAIRKDILDHYLQDEKLVLIYYISGEKFLHDGHYQPRSTRYDLSGCFFYNGNDIKPIQSMYIAEDSYQKLKRWKEEESEKDEFPFEW